jgi:serine/threonine kinase 16
LNEADCHKTLLTNPFFAIGEGNVKMMKLLQWFVSNLSQFLRWLYDTISQMIRQRTGVTVTLDTGKRVVIGKQIAEGGFSYIFEAFDVASKSTPRTRQHYVLKRIHCPDAESLDRCRYEAAVHRAAMPHPHIMPLYGFAMVQDSFYMLFPYCIESLRDTVNRHNVFLQPHPPGSTSGAAPFPEAMALNLFRQICLGVQALHNCGYSHRDVKVENVMVLQKHPAFPGNRSGSREMLHLVLMDFGSAGPMEQPIENRRQLLGVIEQAAQHTTMPYRPPELFEGGITLRNHANGTAQLDYRAVDVWSLGCTLFALLYGASPFEIEFVSPSHRGTASIKIVDCTHLSIIGTVPVPKHPPIASWYSESMHRELIQPMLNQDPQKRPKTAEIIQAIDTLITSLGGSVVDVAANSYKEGTRDLSHYRDDVYNEDRDQNSDGIALLSRVV